MLTIIMNNLEKIIQQNDTIINLLMEIRNAIVEGPLIPITKEEREELDRVFDKKPHPVKVIGYTERPTKEGIE